MRNLITFFILFLPALALAQSQAISGRVLNMANDKPVAGATVFLDNTIVGISTGDDGTFVLNNVRNGQYNITVSCVGFESHRQAIQFNDLAINTGDIKLMPKVTALKEVSVKYDPDRDRHLGMFIKDFLGSTDNARQCKIKNPEILDLDFDKKKNILNASTDNFLDIDNKALGYTLHYQISKFTLNYKTQQLYYEGSLHFEPMHGSESDEKRWKKARLKAYTGSNMHFLRSCISNKVDDEKFTVRRIIRRPNDERPPDSLIKARLKQLFPPGRNNVYVTLTDSMRYWINKRDLPLYKDELVKMPLVLNEYYKHTTMPGVYQFNCKDLLMISYNKDSDRSTTLAFSKPSYFDDNGVIINPTSVVNEGYWGEQRVANMLPFDYDPRSQD
ncbi:carboxypeptidase-like protein [Mucilaginibacter yixingensis]|uniref:Carboxypeptidase-like protein n=1 Tax=Mucilaginibacter yixingensis TaxID=1295612 RepID=A0A2T5J562_9SPHI|nr:carboxypeptidase-like regulatory domain-containing protein [Mucilaginibacter yixingensis]PTQ92895.1 carboxypeptidase-like protein [Mucilaginibacter yixingensis]